MAEVKKDFIQLVCDETGASYEDVKRDMIHARDVLGVLFAEYYNYKMYGLSETQQKIKARRLINLRKKRNERFERVTAATGWNRKEINQRIREINEKGIFKINLLIYEKYAVYCYEGAELEEYLKLLASRRNMRLQLLEDLQQIDAGVKSYGDIGPLLNEYYDAVDKLIPDSFVEKMANELYYSHPELKGDSEASRKAIVKMEGIRVLLPFSLMEYLAFDFHTKDLPEIREFITDVERMKVLNVINDPSCFDILDNKLETYGKFKEYFGREMHEFTSEDDYEAFRGFFTKNKKIVIKQPCETQGRGISLINIGDYPDVRTAFDELMAVDQDFIAEELIIAHDSIKALNPDSVNTVRMITYFDGNKSIVHDTFMKIGQKGSFIDNGGAGGILVSIDRETGRLDSDGRDEKGVTYTEHPYTRTKFNGYQLPDWDKALALGLELADKVPGMSYIGWDITYTADNQWIVVEGNAKTQFVGQQCTIGKGVREDFLNTVNYKE